MSGTSAPPQTPTPRTTAFAKALGVIYAKSYSADYKTVYFAEEAQKLIDEQVATIERELIAAQRELEEARKDEERRETQLFKANELLHQVTRLSTSQDASPQQCCLVTQAMDYFTEHQAKGKQ